MSASEERGRLVQSHAQFEAERPDVRDSELGYENHRRALYIRRHESLDGYRPQREFPCQGVLRVFDETEAHLLICCDVCGYETSCRIDQEPNSAVAF